MSKSIDQYSFAKITFQTSLDYFIEERRDPNAMQICKLNDIDANQQSKFFMTMTQS